jgi:hypothetical protein
VIAELTPSTRPQRSSSGPARIAARDIGGVEQHAGALERAHAGEPALRADRRLRRDEVRRRSRGGDVDIARIAERDERFAIGDLARRTGVSGGRRTPVNSISARSRSVDLDQLALVRLVALARDDADHDIVGIAPGELDDMRVGDDAVGPHREAAAMAEADHFVIDHRDGDDAHHAAGRGGDVVGICRPHPREKQRHHQQQPTHHRTRTL